MKHLLFAAVLLVLASCHSTKKATVAATPAAAPAPADTNTVLPATALIHIADTTYRPPDSSSRALENQPKSDSITELTESIYRFKVSFISIGSGIDHKAKRKYTGFVNDYESKNKVKLPYEEIPWGREGEIDFGFKLQELNAVQQAKFIADSREILKDSPLVRYSEHITPHAPPGKGPGLLGPP